MLIVFCASFRVISRVSSPFVNPSTLTNHRKRTKTPKSGLSAKKQGIYQPKQNNAKFGTFRPKERKYDDKAIQMPGQDKEKNKNKNFEKTHPAPSLARFAPSPPGPFARLAFPASGARYNTRVLLPLFGPFSGFFQEWTLGARERKVRADGFLFPGGLAVGFLRLHDYFQRIQGLARVRRGIH